MVLRPSMVGDLRLWDKWLQPRIGKLIADDSRVDFAVEQHLHKLLALRRPSYVGRVMVFGHMTFLEGHPANGIEIDTVIVGQDPPHPYAGGLRIGPDAKRLPVEIAWAQIGRASRRESG